MQSVSNQLFRPEIVTRRAIGAVPPLVVTASGVIGEGDTHAAPSLCWATTTIQYDNEDGNLWEKVAARLRMAAVRAVWYSTRVQLAVDFAWGGMPLINPKTSGGLGY